MTSLSIVLILVVILNGFFLICFIKDLIKHRLLLKEEPGNALLLAFSSTIIFFLSAFGISDFAISTIFYRMKKLVSDKKLPGTLNTQCVIPVAVMAFSFISSIEVNLLTLVVCIISQVFGAYIGPRFVVKIPSRTIKLISAVGLFIAGCFILADKFNWLPTGGMAIELQGIKLFIAAGFLFVFGALNNIGIGCYPLTMATLYTLGMNPLVSFPIMMGACAFSISIGSMQFIKYGEYSRKITLFTSIFGVIGVLFAVYFIKNLDVSILQWFVAALIFYSSISMLVKEFNFIKFKINEPEEFSHAKE